MEPWVDSAVVLETSCGAIVVDLFGKDVPNGAAWIMDLCASQLMHASIATAVRYGGSLLRFEVAVGSTAAAAVAVEQQSPWRGSVLEAADARTQSIGMLGKKRDGEFQQTGVRLRFSERPGLVLLPKNAAVEASERAVLHAGGVSIAGPLAFYITTTKQNFDFLESDFVAVGQVSEGLPTLQRMQSSHCGRGQAWGSSGGNAAATGKPLRLIRIKHATILAPLPPPHLSGQATALNHDVGSALVSVPTGPSFVLVTTNKTSNQHGGSSSCSTVLPAFLFQYNAQCHDGYLSSDDDGSGAMTTDVRNEVHRRKLDETRQMMLHVMDGITDATVVPPDTVLFVCKLNPMTTSDGLRTCFSQFGKVVSADVIRDAKGNSRCYAFVEFAEQSACDRAFQRMDRALIDDSRVHVDFSQSVSKIWNESRRQQQPGGGGRQQPQASRVRSRDVDG